MSNKQTARIGEGRRGPGRPKGSKNKTTLIAKEAIAKAAENIGGAERLTDWIKEDPENEAAFWKTIYPRLLPVQHEGNVGLSVYLPPGADKV